jgi:hypothetical protein
MPKVTLSSEVVDSLLKVYDESGYFVEPNLEVVSFLVDHCPELRTEKLFQTALHYPKLLEKFVEHGFEPKKGDFLSILQSAGPHPKIGYYADWAWKLNLSPEDVAESLLALDDEFFDDYDEEEWVDIINTICEKLALGKIRSVDHPFLDALTKKWGDSEEVSNMRTFLILKYKISVPGALTSAINTDIQRVLANGGRSYDVYKYAFEYLDKYVTVAPNVKQFLNRYRTVRRLALDYKYERSLYEVLNDDFWEDAERSAESGPIKFNDNYLPRFYNHIRDFDLTLKVGRDLEMSHAEVVISLLETYVDLEPHYDRVTISELSVFFDGLKDLSPILKVWDDMIPVVRKYLRDYRNVKMVLSDEDRELEETANPNSAHISSYYRLEDEFPLISIENPPKVLTGNQVVSLIRKATGLPLKDLTIHGSKMWTILDRDYNTRITNDDIFGYNGLLFKGISDGEAEKIEWPLVIEYK